MHRKTNPRHDKATNEPDTSLTAGSASAIFPTLIYLLPAAGARRQGPEPKAARQQGRASAPTDEIKKGPGMHSTNCEVVVQGRADLERGAARHVLGMSGARIRHQARQAARETKCGAPTIPEGHRC